MTTQHSIVLLPIPNSLSIPRIRLTVSEDANGKLHVKKTEKHYEFLTKSKVGKVG
jgi:hypothetical protein